MAAEWDWRPPTWDPVDAATYATDPLTMGAGSPGLPDLGAPVDPGPIPTGLGAPIPPIPELGVAPLPGLAPEGALPDALAAPPTPEEPAPAPAPMPGDAAPSGPEGAPDALAPASAPDTFDALSPGPGPADVLAPVDPYDQAARERDLAGQSAEEYAASQARWQAARDAEVAEQRAKIMREDRAAAEENERRMAESRAKAKQSYEELAAEADRIAETEVDPKRWFQNASIGELVGASIATMIGGYLNPRGKNTGLEHVMGLVDRDIEAQRNQLDRRDRANARKQGLVGQLYSMGLDEYQAAEAARLASFRMMDQKLAEAEANYDPAGATAFRIQDARRKVREEEAKAKQAAEDRTLRRKIEEDKNRREWAKFREDKKTTREQLDMQQDRLDLERERYDFDREKLAADERAAKQAAEARLTAEQAEKQRKYGVGAPGELMNADGEPMLARNETVADALGSLKTQVDDSAYLLNEVIRLRNEYGWNSELWKSDEWRVLKQKWTQLALNRKDIDQLGVLAGDDLDLIYGAMGTDDPSEWRDPAPAMMRTREDLLRKFDLTLRNRGQYSGPTYVTPADRERYTDAPDVEHYYKLMLDPSLPADQYAKARKTALKMAKGDSDEEQRFADVMLMSEARRLNQPDRARPTPPPGSPPVASR